MRISLIKKLLLLAALPVLAALLLPLPGSAKVDRELCEVCGRYWDSSPQRCRAYIDLGHSNIRTIYACSLFCLLEKLEDYEDKGEERTLQVVLYSDRDSTGAVMLVLDKAWFVYGIEGDDQKVHEPYMAAFRNERAAREAQKELGGEVINFDSAHERVKKLTDDWEPQPSKEYTPLLRGRHAKR